MDEFLKKVNALRPEIEKYSDRVTIEDIEALPHKRRRIIIRVIEDMIDAFQEAS